jgi:hypothetical protein
MQMMIKGDKILVVVLVLLSFGVWFYLGNMENDVYAQSFVQITVEGEVYKKVPLSVNNIIGVQHNDNYNVIEINNGTARMIKANCYNLNCLRHGAISNTRSSIVCLPNRVLVEIVSDAENEIDLII